MKYRTLPKSQCLQLSAVKAANTLISKAYSEVGGGGAERGHVPLLRALTWDGTGKVNCSVFMAVFRGSTNCTNHGTFLVCLKEGHTQLQLMVNTCLNGALQPQAKLA